MRIPELVRHVPSGLLLVCAARQAHKGEVGELEQNIFRALNDAPDNLRVPAWAVMQSGSLGAVFVAAGAQHLRRTNTLTVLAAGTTVWAGSKALKLLVRRGRPEHHLEAVRIRGAVQSGLGFPSGHAAVATTLAVLTTSAGVGRVGALAVAAITGGARVYVGAHLPLDIVGGFAIGAIAGGLR